MRTFVSGYVLVTATLVMGCSSSSAGGGVDATAPSAPSGPRPGAEAGHAIDTGSSADASVDAGDGSTTGPGPDGGAACPPASTPDGGPACTLTTLDYQVDGGTSAAFNGAIASNSTAIYWIYEFGDIYQAPFSGAPPSTLVSFQTLLGIAGIDTGQYIISLAADDQFVYFTLSVDTMSGESPAVLKVPVGGGNPTVLVQSPPFFGNGGGSNPWVSPGAIVVSPTALYWSEESDVYMVGLTGGAPVQMPGTVWGVVAADATGIYTAGTGTDGDTEAYRIDPTTFAVTTLGSAPTSGALQASEVPSIALDANNVYWTPGSDTAAGDALVLSVPKTGGTPITLASQGIVDPGPTQVSLVPYFHGLVVDDTNAYWIATGTFVELGTVATLNLGPATIMSVPKGGGPSTVLATTYATCPPGTLAARPSDYAGALTYPFQGPLMLAVNGPSLYWATTGPLCTGTPGYGPGTITRLTPRSGGSCCAGRDYDCPAGESLTNGLCCPTGQTGCNGACVDLQTDQENCGQCLNLAAIDPHVAADVTTFGGGVCGEQYSCQSGQCACAPGEDCNPGG